MWSAGSSRLVGKGEGEGDRGETEEETGGGDIGILEGGRYEVVVCLKCNLPPK